MQLQPHDTNKLLIRIYFLHIEVSTVSSQLTAINKAISDFLNARSSEACTHDALQSPILSCVLYADGLSKNVTNTIKSAFADNVNTTKISSDQASVVIYDFLEDSKDHVNLHNVFIYLNCYGDIVYYLKIGHVNNQNNRSSG